MVAAFVLAAIALFGSHLVKAQSACADGSMVIASNSASSCGQVPGLTVGTTTTGTPGSSASVTNSGTSVAPILAFTVPAGAIGAAGAGWIPAKLTSSTSGTITWTFPAGCIGSGNAPAIFYSAEGPNPANGVSVNVQTVGVVGVNSAVFQVTKQTATTVGLLGLTIAVTAAGTAVGATILDVGCLPQ